MKIDIMGGQVVDVVFNPGRKTDGRPSAGLEYTAALRASSNGVVRLTLATDFTPPCLLVELTEMAGPESADLLRRLGMAVSDDGWTQVRATYAFIDGVRYAPPSDEELEFMAAFGFTPGARFDLALPMLRAQRAGWPLADQRQSWNSDEVLEALPAPVRPEDDPGWSPAQEKILNEMQAVEDSLVAAGVAPTEQELTAASNAAVGPPSPSVTKPAKRQRRSAKPAGKVEIVSQVLGETTEEMLVPAAVADVFDVLDAAPAPKPAPAAMEGNPFMIEGL